MYQCNIRVLETTVQKFSDELHIPPVGPCPVFSVGQEWTLSHYGRPLDFCENAWTASHRTVYAVLSGAGSAIGGSWVEDGKQAIVCCNDGRRPVIFELTRVEAGKDG